MRTLRLIFIANISYHRQISRALNVPSTTVIDYCKRFEITNLSIIVSWKSLQKSYKTRPKPNVEYIHKEIAKKGVTFELLWQEYKEQYPDGYDCSQFKESTSIRVEFKANLNIGEVKHKYL